VGIVTTQQTETGSRPPQPDPREAAAKRRRKGHDRYAGILFVLPAFIFIFVFMLYPLVSSGYLSLTEYNFVYDDEPVFVGFDNYVRAFEDPQFITSLVNTFVFGFFYFIALMLISLGIALLLYQKVRFNSFYRSAVFVPLVVPLSLAALVFVWILQPNYGLLNHVLSDVFNMPFLAQPWLSQGGTAMASIIVLSLWVTIGFQTILFLAGLQAIDEEMLEAAELDGVSGLKKVFYILLPNLRETFVLTGTWGILHALKVFVEPMVLTDGGPGTATLVLYQQVYLTAFSYFDMGYASAMGYILGLIILVLVVLNFVFLRTKSDRRA
jgi:ABC-type sugar transport system permease subunit